jgi:hypothetical protein
LAHVSVPWSITWVQFPHALDDLSPDTTHACEPAAQMPLNPVEQDRGEPPVGHWQKVDSVLSACPLQSLSLLDVQSRERLATF